MGPGTSSLQLPYKESRWKLCLRPKRDCNSLHMVPGHTQMPTLADDGSRSARQEIRKSRESALVHQRLLHINYFGNTTRALKFDLRLPQFSFSALNASL